MSTKFISLDPVLLTILIVLIISVLLTLLSNFFTCLIFFSKKNRKSRAKFLLGNIALSDIVYILVFIIPLMIIEPLICEKYLYFSHIIQSINNYLNATCIYVSSMTMTVIALDRYYAIIYTTRKNPFDKFSTKSLLISLWFLSLILSIPFLVTFDIYSLNFKNLTIDCLRDENYFKNTFLLSDQRFQYISRKLRFLLHYLIPVLMTTYFYSRIIYHLFKKKNSEIRVTNVWSQRKVWQTIKMLIAVVIVFSICNFAFYFNNMKDLLGLEPEKEDPCIISTAMTYTCYIVFVTSCLLNPFIYWWMSPTFRQDFKRIIIFWNF
jgi:hypothetical protein